MAQARTKEEWFCGQDEHNFLTCIIGSGIQIPMKSIDEQILRATKEIVVKFIEMGRLSPSNVHESFKDIYTTVNETVKQHVIGPHASHEDKK